MAELNLINIFWSIAIFVYYLIKDRIIAKIFKDGKTKLPPIYSLITATTFLLLNFYLQSEYERYLNLTYIKGSIKLPNFTLVFIAADFISSAFFVSMIKIKHGVRTKFLLGRVVIDIFRLMTLTTIFTLILSSSWTNQTTRNMNFDYYCFQKQIAMDLAEYYLKNSETPNNLSDFTVHKINPKNNSPLIYERGESIISTEVTDAEGNLIMAGYKDLTGIGTYEDMPERYFELQRKTTGTICPNLSFP